MLLASSDSTVATSPVQAHIRQFFQVAGNPCSVVSEIWRSLPLPLSLSLSLPPSLPPFLSLSLPLSLFIYLSLSLPISLSIMECRLMHVCTSSPHPSTVAIQSIHTLYSSILPVHCDHTHSVATLHTCAEGYRSSHLASMISLHHSTYICMYSIWRYTCICIHPKPRLQKYTCFLIHTCIHIQLHYCTYCM